MTVIGDFLKAVGQLGDPRFRKVLLLGVGLTLLLLVGAYALALWLLDWLVPETLTIWGIGEVTWVDELLSGASILLMLVASVFLMVPVSSAFTSLFLEDVTDAVEARHYPHLDPAPKLGFAEGLRDSVNFLGVLLLANLLAVIVYLIILPGAPFIFVAMNGYLLGREYFQLIARRRHSRAEASALRKQHRGTVWLAGILMTAPLVVPVVNLLVPVLGAATFTHLYHRLARPARSGAGPSDRTSRYRAG